MLPVLLLLSLVFALAFLGRVGAARRAALVARWPAALFAGAAFFALARGALWPALVLGALAAATWVYWPRARRLFGAPPKQENAADTAADREARALLGVGPAASAEEIRRAYRSKMAKAHPDKGGTHNDAARLTAARDRLLKGR
ncbi:MAG: DnaJ domain-containing protein [Hyphomonadaceae bacterium]|nr:DnaJ domain-containing protein [Hyphomonadaceae bacterium]MBX3511067.1 DnaJ domain-containing protein [Hyphomonadaceae bacterium]